MSTGKPQGLRQCRARLASPIDYRNATWEGITDVDMGESKITRLPSLYGHDARGRIGTFDHVGFDDELEVLVLPA